VDEPFATKLIHTIRGVGYCVREEGSDQSAAGG
jgi:DNA-binding response OmpR family regulator